MWWQALRRLHKTKNGSNFYNNRVAKSCDLVPVANWSHCLGKYNPADLPYRGISAKELQSNKIWLHGPTWLPTMSPKHQIKMSDECVSKLKGNDCAISHSLMVSTTIGSVMDYERCCKLHKLLRVTVYVQKFVLCLKSFTRHNHVH